MIKVLHFVTDFPGSQSATSTLAVRNLLEATSEKLEHTVVIVDREKSFKVKQISLKLYYICIPRFKFGLLNSTFSLVAFILFSLKFDIIKESDIIHCHKLTIDGVFGLFSNIFYEKSYVVSVRGATDEKWLKNKFYAQLLFKAILQRAKHIFFVSAWMQPFIERKYNTDISIKSSLLPNLCGCEFKADSIIFNASKKLLFVGRLSIWRSKGLDKIIEAISKMPELTLDVIGKRDEKAIAEMREFAISVDCKATVNFLGGMENKELRNIMSEYFCLAMPSYPETFGMVYVEALSEKIPVITSNRAGIAGYINDKIYVRAIDERNTAELQEAIIFFIQNQSYVKRIIQHDSSTLLSNMFSDNIIAEKYIVEICESK